MRITVDIFGMIRNIFSQQWEKRFLPMSAMHLASAKSWQCSRMSDWSLILWDWMTGGVTLAVSIVSIINSFYYPLVSLAFLVIHSSLLCLILSTPQLNPSQLSLLLAPSFVYPAHFYRFSSTSQATLLGQTDLYHRGNRNSSEKHQILSLTDSKI